MLPDTLWLPHPTGRPDEHVLAEVCDRLWLDDTTRASERSALAVDVRNGHVFLTGHVTNQLYREHVIGRVRSVRGVQVVHDALVADPDLRTQVAQALAANARTRSAMIRVGASHGWVLLAGEVPDEATRTAAEEVAAQVAAVRGVLSLPSLPYGQARRAENRRGLQPRVGQAAYATDGQAGRIKLVVMSPRSRLVSHLIVAGTPEVNWLPVRGRWVVPIEAVAQAGEGGVFLADQLSGLVARPAYVAGDFRQPPAEWRLPFPYAAGEVHWPAEPAATTIANPRDDYALASSLAWPAAVIPIAV